MTTTTVLLAVSTHADSVRTRHTLHTLHNLHTSYPAPLVPDVSPHLQRTSVSYLVPTLLPDCLDCDYSH